MRLTWIEYYAPFKRYAWLVIDRAGYHNWFKYKKDAEIFFKEECLTT